MKIKICGLDYEVKGDAMTNSGYDGLAKPTEQEIVIRKGLHRDRVIQTFIHEVLHIILMECEYGELSKDEKLIQALAMNLQSVFVDQKCDLDKAVGDVKD